METDVGFGFETVPMNFSRVVANLFFVDKQRLGLDLSHLIVYYSSRAFVVNEKGKRVTLNGPIDTSKSELYASCIVNDEKLQIVALVGHY
jgi:hypothetical protein